MTKSSTLSKNVRFWIVSFYQDVHAATCNSYIYDRATTFENIWHVFIEKNSIKNAIRNGCHSMENCAYICFKRNSRRSDICIVTVRVTMYCAIDKFLSHQKCSGK